MYMDIIWNGKQNKKKKLSVLDYFNNLGLCTLTHLRDSGEGGRDGNLHCLSANPVGFGELSYGGERRNALVDCQSLLPQVDP